MSEETHQDSRQRAIRRAGSAADYCQQKSQILVPVKARKATKRSADSSLHRLLINIE